MIAAFIAINLNIATGQNGAYGSSTLLYDNTTFQNKSIDVNLAVGATPGEAGVSNGSATYQIPIYVPPGTNGVQPSVSVVYNSMQGQGVMGMGWSLAAGSAISVGPKSVYFDGEASPVELNGEDAFYLDGQRLINISGSNGYNGAKYGLEVEDWSEITSYGGSNGNPDWFKVHKKDGMIYEYGHYSTDSKFMHDGDGKAIMWYLSKIIYPDKNYIEYSYTHSGDETVLDKILYTNNLDLNNGHFAEVDFSYETRIDKGKSYLKGQEINSTMLLTKIEAKTEGQLARKYIFDYGHDNINSFLTEVMEYGADGVSRYNSTIFKYGEVGPNLSYAETDVSVTYAADQFVGDFNGDGYSDLLVAQKDDVNNVKIITRFDIFTNDGDGTFSLFYASGNLNVYIDDQEYTNKGIRVSDFNGDGYDDILLSFIEYSTIQECRAYVDQIKMYNGGENTLTSFSIPVPSSLQWTYSTIEPCAGNGSYFTLGDFDGDGTSDYLIIGKRGLYAHEDEWDDDMYKAFVSFPSKNQYNIELDINTLYSPYGDMYQANKEWVHGTNYEAINIDSDSKTELMIVKGGYSRIFKYDGIQNGKALFPEIDESGFPTQWHKLYFGDINNDGLTDILSRTSKTNDNTQWTRYYFGDYEKVVDGTGTEHIHYISGGEGVVAIVSKKNNVTTFNYTYTDHLGSIVTVTDALGTKIAEQNYDPWGRERHPDTWTYSSPSSKPSWLYRGYTGHEMMPEFSLVNMNRRIYDPLVGRMLSVDNFIHEQAGTQGYNRYSYALNNPLSYTDPDGEWVQLAFAAIGVAVNGIINYSNGDPFFQGWVGAAIGGAFSGGYLSAVGSAVSSHLPSANINLGGGFSLNLSPALAFGSNGLSLAGNVNLGYLDGKFSAGIGVGLGYTNMQLGDNVAKGFTSSVGGGISLGDHNGLNGGLYTNITGGAGIGQQVGGLRLGYKKTSLTYENDRAPFSSNMSVNDGKDRFRTNAVSIAGNGWDVRLNMFTGDSYDQIDESSSERYPYGLKTGDGDMYRLGALSFGYGGHRVGWNSEGIRHLFQNKFAHSEHTVLGFKILKGQGYFKTLSNGYPGSFYSETTSFNNPYSLWSF